MVKNIFTQKKTVPMIRIQEIQYEYFQSLIHLDISEILKNTGNHLIIAHSNSLRAIIKILEKLSDKDIMSVNIPTGVPLVYELDENFLFINKEYLINDEELKMKQKIILL